MRRSLEFASAKATLPSWGAPLTPPAVHALLTAGWPHPLCPCPLWGGGQPCSSVQEAGVGWFPGHSISKASFVLIFGCLLNLYLHPSSAFCAGKAGGRISSVFIDLLVFVP